MRVLAVADIHGNQKAIEKVKKKAKKVDLVIMGGDFTIFGNHMEQIMRKLNAMTKKTLVITGNHETESKVRTLCKKFKNLYFMNNKIMKINNILIYGYDTNGFSFRDRPFEKDSKKFVKAIKKERAVLKKTNKKRKDKIKLADAKYKKPKIQILKTIFISHAPAYKTKADKIMDEHCGSKSVRDFCIKNKIDYCFCGHIHEGSHTVDKVKNTIVVNSGPYGMVFEI